MNMYVEVAYNIVFILTCGIADGYCIPPMVIFDSKSLHSDWQLEKCQALLMVHLTVAGWTKGYLKNDSKATFYAMHHLHNHFSSYLMGTCHISAKTGTRSCCATTSPPT